MNQKLAARLREGEKELAVLDKVMAELIKNLGPIEIRPRGEYFESLTRSMIGQQVSVAAARAIFNRLRNSTGINPKKIEGMETEELRELGLSRQKSSYIKDLAAHFVEDPQVFDHLDELDDQAVIEELITVKGVGPWTAQMFLMFTLVRPDVFAPDDLGLQKAIKQLYTKKKLVKPQHFSVFAEKWKPHRTIASWYLWRFTDTALYQ